MRPTAPIFRRRRIRANGIALNAMVGGAGPPLLLLHGYPQTHAMWHAVAPDLASEWTVICPDLRGYGDSAKPPGGPEHAAYSKRAMAQDMVDLMAALGHERFHLVGHDRGGRVAHRLAMDHPGRVAALSVLDIAPTLAMYQRTDMAFAQAYWHWFLFIQPHPVPEIMVQAGGVDLLWRRHTMAAGAIFHPRALAEYRRCFTPKMIHASCEDYRASAGIDLEHDRADRAAGRTLAMPLQVLWGSRGVVGRQFDPMALWREVADDVTGQAIDCGHYMAEEKPAEVLAALQSFLNRHRGA